MTETTLAEKIAHLAAPLAASLGLEVWGVEVGAGVVRVFADALPQTGAGDADTGPGEKDAFRTEGGVSIDACADLSRLLGATLDTEDLIAGAYTLEVSSPGLARLFFSPAQLAAYVGGLSSSAPSLPLSPALSALFIPLSMPSPMLPTRR